MPLKTGKGPQDKVNLERIWNCGERIYCAATPALIGEGRPISKDKSSKFQGLLYKIQRLKFANASVISLALSQPEWPLLQA